ncbi:MULTISPECIES: GntR family transcriptional regulator [Halomonadaceae]|jgi:DNA-binding GntR family transcriptional regulator|uniref:GntR family transcriptional regulator n=1 Tax=Vreelandella janggokensis TaxID=370767 RepID=A0ABT4IPU3_9GAMM|nr:MULTISPECIES: GntR family transcriptional regulator [Halomonas]MCW4152677.1 GntR family transcriptional regulator [Halomonas sp. 18H]MCZ0925686.1 GntR family transcriptional regulator [Halomonas janggokensis]MDR5886805.1 GntR family transcriptional regulator [Halomonas janggokensis]QPL47291.1 GntR family transcriptional regulator [Halomonas sp. A40-4]
MANTARIAPASVVQTATTKVHEVIKQRILDGHYQAHEYIREANIARELDVSRTPVREALRELVSEGWLEMIPHHGSRVTAWTEKDAREVFELRLVLEPMAVRMASERMTRECLTKLEAMASHMEQLTEMADTTPSIRNEIASINHEFHRELIHASGNQRLGAVLESVVRTSVIRRNFSHYDLASLRRSMRHHREILEAIKVGSPLWAEQIMSAHLLAAKSLNGRFSDSAES